MPECELHTRLEGKIDEILDAQKSFAGAFAKDRNDNADFFGHRAYHEAVITAAKEQAAFWRSMRYEITKKGILFLLITVSGLALLGLVVKFYLFATKLGFAVPVK